MQQCLDYNWCENLAAHLVDVSISTFNDHPVFVHRTGLRWNVCEIPISRRRFSIYSMMADNSNTNRECPIRPPTSITLDSHRPLPKLAQELQRRLIDPGLLWYAGANAWRIQDAAAQQRENAIRRLFIGLGGSSPTHTDQIFGYDPCWTAQISPSGSVSLQIRSIDYEQALSIIESLQKGK